MMNLNDVWSSVIYIRNEDEEIIAVEVPIDMWRFLMDRVQEMEDKQAARDRLVKLRKSQEIAQASDE
jgi:hypothetical protein